MKTTPLVLVAMLAAVAPGTSEEWVLHLDPALTTVGFLLQATMHTVEGVIPLVSGEIRFDRTSGKAGGHVVLDSHRTTTHNTARDKKMHAEVLESERFPSIVFRPAHIEVREEGVDRGTVRLGGTVLVHGAEHPVELDVAVRREGDRIVAYSPIEIPYVAWGMRDPSVFVLRVAKVVQVQIHAEGTLTIARGGSG
jgi:hypothetical protein